MPYDVHDIRSCFVSSIRSLGALGSREGAGRTKYDEGMHDDCIVEVDEESHSLLAGQASQLSCLLGQRHS